MFALSEIYAGCRGNTKFIAISLPKHRKSTVDSCHLSALHVGAARANDSLGDAGCAFTTWQPKRRV
jgi:hypothetical protein